MVEDTIPKQLKQNSEKFGDQRIAMREKVLGIWNEITWQEYYDNSKYLGLGLISLGLEYGDRVCIIGDNGPEWYWGDVGSQAVGGVPVGIFTDCTPPEIKYIVDNSESRFALAKDQEQVDKFLSIKEELPSLAKVIYWDSSGMWDYDDQILVGFEEVQELGRQYEQAHPGFFEKRVAETSAGDLAFLAYTSGTTGLPKGAIVSQSNLMSCARAWFSMHPPDENDQYVSQVAPAWLPEQWFGIAIPTSGGTAVDFCESPETVQVDMREIAPQVLAAPPRAWEMIASRVQALIMDAGLINRLVYNLILPVGYKVADLHYQKKQVPLFWKLLHGFAYLTVFRPLTDKLGQIDEKVGITSGGFLAPDIFHYLRALGVRVKQAYALTEAGLVSFHRDDDIKYETVGQIVAGNQVRIADDGEIMTKGPMTISGYWRNPEATAEKLKGGWLRTGDAGHFDDDGHFVILDRVADLVDLPGGGKFSPSYIEGRLRFSPYIREVMVVGGGSRPYVTAIISIEFETVSRWAETNHIAYTTLVDLSQKAEVSELIRKDLVRVNKSLPEMSKVKKFVNLHKEMDADDAELTRTKKLRRNYTETQYKDVIAALYSDESAFSIQTDVKYRDGRVGQLSTALSIAVVD
ncbi:MAG: AMP-binding protein [Chloroflexota bacterium]|nr:AMP-binding protein [Chloroflexota bacterium]